jgi:EAL domain-containing protein (putative c-di-GMP-specific phosphodiesterase class I)
LQDQKFLQEVESILQRNGIQESQIKFEITETAAMINPQQAIEQLHALRRLGIELAIDDFGTGYSSLAYLKRLPIDTLKLDRTFVDDIDGVGNDAAISAATLALAHNLGLRVVAEGVETELQRNFLVEHQCDYLQGYLFSRPLPAAEVSQRMRLQASAQ